MVSMVQKCKWFSMFTYRFNLLYSCVPKVQMFEPWLKYL